MRALSLFRLASWGLSGVTLPSRSVMTPKKNIENFPEAWSSLQFSIPQGNNGEIAALSRNEMIFAPSLREWNQTQMLFNFYVFKGQLYSVCLRAHAVISVFLRIPLGAPLVFPDEDRRILGLVSKSGRGLVSTVR